MTIADAFRSPKLLLDRAREHIADFARQERAFFDQKPYTAFTELEPDTGFEIHKLKFTGNPPDRLAVIGSEALSHIRHVLDQSVVASVLACDPAVT
jgi:hypothetical protein